MASSCFSMCCGAGGAGTGGKAKSVVKTLHTWRSPHLHPAERLLCLAFHKLVPVYRMADLSPERDADQIREIRAKVSAVGGSRYGKLVVKPGWRVEEVEVPRPGDGGECKIFLHRPPGADGERLPLLYWVHGGGMTVGNAKDGYGAGMVTNLLERGVPVVWASVEYRLSPEHAFPAGFDDCLQGLLHLLRTPGLPQRLGFDPSDVHIGGVSAGAGLAAALAGAMSQGGTPEFGAVRSVLIDEPMLDPTMASDSYVENADARTAPVPWLAWSWAAYLRGYPGGMQAALGDVRVCPHLHPPTTAGAPLPPFLVVTALGDPLRDEGRAYAEALRGAGAPVTHVEARGSHAMALLFDRAKREAVYKALVEMLRAGSAGRQA